MENKFGLLCIDTSRKENFCVRGDLKNFFVLLNEKKNGSATNNEILKKILKVILIRE